MRKSKIFAIIICSIGLLGIGAISFQGAQYATKVIEESLKDGEKQVAKKDTESKEDTSEIKIGATNTTSSTDTVYDGVADVAEAVLPSIVAIDVVATENVSDMFGRTYEQEATGSGSGIIVSQKEDELLIVTNNHVVEDANKVSVKFNDGNVYEATVKGTDATMDLAVVSVKGSTLGSDTINSMKVAVVGDSDALKVGEQAIAIGNALGYGTSVTVGYISAKDREVSTDDATMKLIQTDAAINPGNSGGALVNAKGEVIGINSAKYASTEVEGMGFAIPITKALPIIEEIVNREAVPEDKQAYLGIKGTDVEAEYAEYYNMPEGVYVGSVTENSPAQKGGLLLGDIIVAFDGKETTTMESLQQRLSYCKAGTEVTIKVKRLDSGEYKEKELKITLGNKSEMPEEESGKQETPSNGNREQIPDGGDSYGNDDYYNYYDYFSSPFGW